MGGREGRAPRRADDKQHRKPRIQEKYNNKKNKKKILRNKKEAKRMPCSLPHKMGARERKTFQNTTGVLCFEETRNFVWNATKGAYGAICMWIHLCMPPKY